MLIRIRSARLSDRHNAFPNPDRYMHTLTPFSPSLSPANPPDQVSVQEENHETKSGDSRSSAAFPTPDISDLMNRLYTMDPGIKDGCLRGETFAPACTVKSSLETTSLMPGPSW